MIQLVAGAAFIALVLAASRVSPGIDLFRFPLAWLGVLVALDGLARLRRGASPLRTPGDWVATGAASVVFWDLFELVNLRLRNWWYVGVSPRAVESTAFAALSFATVLPALRLGLAQLRPPLEVPLNGGRCSRAAAGLGALALALAFPRFAFPLAWLFLWPICEALSGVRVRLRAMAVGLPFGLVWESLNWGCARGWIYTVPFFQRPKLFEMPLPGYLGYLPFALECAAALALLDRLRLRLRGPAAVAALVAVLAFHAAVDQVARGQTVVSFSR